MQNDRNDLIKELESHKAIGSENSHLGRIIELLSEKDCFHRSCFPAHITGSAILLNVTGDKLLMNHHKFLDLWLGFGGHCDGDEDVLSVAIRETMEESGLTAFKPISPSIADIDIHPVPINTKKDEPAHEHFDIRYIMQMTDNQKPIISDESIDLQWMTFDEALSVIPDHDGLFRLIEKARNI